MCVCVGGGGGGGYLSIMVRKQNGRLLQELESSGVLCKAIVGDHACVYRIDITIALGITDVWWN